MLTFGSLFAGIGGNDLALERAGMRNLWQVELDPWCRAVLAKHWPDVERFADVRDCGAGNLRPVDLICGGFPCQDISVAGRGAGITGAKSGLWGEFFRVVRELRPRYVLVENSPALKARGLGVVLGDLASIGYDAEWDCIPASAIGAPHERDRIWIVAYPGGTRRQQVAGGASADEGSDEGRAAQDDHLPASHGQGRRAGDVADAYGSLEAERGQCASAPQEGSAGRAQPRRGDGDAQRQVPDDGAGQSAGDSLRASAARNSGWKAEPPIRRVAYGLPRGLDERRNTGVGNSVVPQLVEWIGRRIVMAEQ